MRRARPLLGTYVEIRSAGSAQAVRAAFGAIESVHRLMSFHEADSELTTLNREAHRHPVMVHPWTWHVLRTCRWFYRLSRGVFDPTVAQYLVAAGRLPAPSVDSPDPSATFAHVQFLDQRRIRFHRSLWLDLGGIAKGFAVDVAIATLRAHGVRQATVNAGGDLRAMGPEAAELWLRDPQHPASLIPAGTLADGACATSGNYFAESGGTWNILSRSTNAQPLGASVTVIARRCLWADALTKIVALDALAARPLLDRLRASVLFNSGLAAAASVTRETSCGARGLDEIIERIA